MRKNILLGLILTTTVGIAAAVAAIDKSNSPSTLPEQVRVAIVRDSREVDLAIHGSYRIRDMSSGKVIGKGNYLTDSKVRLLDRGILMGLDVYPARRLTIEPSRDASIVIDERAFRGEVTFIRTTNNHITVVNNINVEDYIKGVLYHEVSHLWPMEALKAQAVATRTYALYSINPAGKPYDMTNDIYSQVYGGRDSERYRTDLAVDYTRGQVLTYNGKIIPAYFHATCGGMTEDAHELWNLADIPPLRGVPCPFCQNSPHFHWKKNFRLRNIQDALNLHGYKVGAIKDISIVDRDRSERIAHLKITQKDGQELLIKGKDFRDLMGPNVLMSNNYDITMQGYYVNIIGKGWGHGVGMCQWGALGMARQQFTYKQILAYYYPQSVLINYHELPKSETIKDSKQSTPK
jgi:stage II sporulation protein D